jgi:hypothetical protein
MRRATANQGAFDRLGCLQMIFANTIKEFDMDLSNYRTLGRSGLIVSPLALGTMTFGAERWGAGTKGSRQLFDT